MNKLHKNNQGIAHLAIIIVVIVSAAVGGVGYKVWKNKQDKDKKAKESSQQAQETEKKEEVKEETKVVDEEANNWALLTSGAGGFTLRIPDGWKVSNVMQNNSVFSQDIIYKKGTKAVINEVEPGGSDTIFRFTARQFKDGDNYKFINGDEQKTEFNTDKLKGFRYYKKYPLEEQRGIGPFPGTEEYIYQFKTEGKDTYVTYRIFNKNQFSEVNVKATDPNQLDIVERMVRTLEIK